MKPVSKKQARYLRALLSGQNQLKKSSPCGAGSIVTNIDGQVLLGQRTDTQEWVTPGGKVNNQETFKTAAIRELQEETGLLAKSATSIDQFSTTHNNTNWDTEVFLVKSYTGELSGNGELDNLQFFHVADLPWDDMSNYTKTSIQNWQNSHPTIQSQLSNELSKNIIRSGNAPSDTIFEVTHADAMNLVGTGTFRMLRSITKDMNDEDFKKVGLDSYTLSIRKHVSDVYSGRIEDGHKTVHQFTNKSLPAVCAELMSVFEWYSPEDEPHLTEFAESSLSDQDVTGGVSSLLDNYSKHNLANIYEEMEHIRKEIRVGVATDISQVEKRLMGLFDKFESILTETNTKHNELAVKAGEALDDMEAKLRSLQTRIAEAQPKQPKVVNGFSSDPEDPTQIHNTYYPHLPKPTVMINPNGSIKISFEPEWQIMEQENFLTDLKVKISKKRND